MKKKVLAALAVLGVAASNTFAAAQDWSSLGTAVTDEIGAVMPIGLTIFGSILAVAIGKKVLRRIAG